MAGSVRADDISNNFAAVNQTSLDAFAEDLGAVVGGGSFHTGKALGFPVGFDVGVHVPVGGVQEEDAILKDDGSTVIGKWVQAEAGLPARLNLIARVGQIEDADGYGGGLRIGLVKSSVPGLPNISLTGLYTKLTHDDFNADTVSGNLVLSFDVPFIHPYLGAGLDHTTVDVKDNPALPAGTGSLEASIDGYRAEAGINLSLIPFTYLNLGGGLANGEKMYHAALGIKL